MMCPTYECECHPQTGCVLPEGHATTSPPSGQTDVYHQLHGDGKSDRGSTVLSSNTWPADKSNFSAPKKGKPHLVSFHPSWSSNLLTSLSIVAMDCRFRYISYSNF